MRYFWSLSAAGFAATAIGFGPARMGFGLFVPEFRSAFSMSSSAVGFVSSLGFFGFLIGLLIAQALLDRRGPGLPVLSGLAAATFGMGLVALAPNLPVLALGVFTAASSAGLAWTPFNNAIHRYVSDQNRPAALSVVSTGTGIGIALAGLAALVMVLLGISWRLCWAFFAAASAVALVGNWAAFCRIDKNAGGGPRDGWKDLIHPPAIPLFAIGFAYGTTSAVFIAFAADHMVNSGGMRGIPVNATPAFVYICYGLFGLTGLLTGRVRDRIGLPVLLRLLMLAGAISVSVAAIFPDNWMGLAVSSGLQGVHVMMTSAVLAFWSERLFPALPSLSFTAALLAAAAGSVLGPALAGVASDAFGAGAMLLGTATLPILTALVLRNRHVRDTPR
ncbi:MFS transporter [Roseinatronobacter sp. S2]|uniref:MFS transporter n=1 Tax=Roseinatronobacter sp. S2 TaxID=3035471 RepID=UPI00240F78E1|nr:MFS transporter [Roseinatronobacter sp. S2]WFE76551.1 MFS transporter [Roseinatronobacter sp. S2]